MKNTMKKKWFSWWGLIFSTLFLNWIGAWIYLIYKANKQIQESNE